jgi:hypothetical protein
VYRDPRCHDGMFARSGLIGVWRDVVVFDGVFACHA